MDKVKPVVVIRCITYNHAEYIRQCLDGFIMQQTSFPFVAVVHDDASTDGTAEIVREYATKYPNIILPILEFENQWSKHDGSLKKIMDNACENSGAKYIAECEGDDYWTNPYKLQKQVDYMEEHEGVGLCVTDFCTQADMDSLSKPAFANGLFKPQTFEEHLINAGYIGPMTWLYRKKVYNQFKMENNLTDGTFALALNFFAISKVAYIDDVTAVYRSHIGSATQQTDPKKAFRYSKGVFQTQLDYAQKYNCGENMTIRLKTQGYADRLHGALEAGDTKFIEEALDFARSQGMEWKWMVEDFKRYVEYHRQYEMIKSSKAYKLGKAILSPIKKVLKK